MPALRRDEAARRPGEHGPRLLPSSAGRPCGHRRAAHAHQPELHRASTDDHPRAAHAHQPEHHRASTADLHPDHCARHPRRQRRPSSRVGHRPACPRRPAAAGRRSAPRRASRPTQRLGPDALRTAHRPSSTAGRHRDPTESRAPILHGRLAHRLPHRHASTAGRRRASAGHRTTRHLAAPRQRSGRHPGAGAHCSSQCEPHAGLRIPYRDRHDRRRRTREAHDRCRRRRHGAAGRRRSRPVEDALRSSDGLRRRPWTAFDDRRDRRQVARGAQPFGDSSSIGAADDSVAPSPSEQRVNAKWPPLQRGGHLTK